MYDKGNIIPNGGRIYVVKSAVCSLGSKNLSILLVLAKWRCLVEQFKSRMLRKEAYGGRSDLCLCEGSLF